MTRKEESQVKKNPEYEAVGLYLIVQIINYKALFGYYQKEGIFYLRQLILGIKVMVVKKNCGTKISARLLRSF